MALLGRSYTTPIVVRGADDAAPAVVPDAPPTLKIVSAWSPLPSRAAVVMSSAPADIFFGGITVASVPRPAPAVAPVVVLRGANDAAVVDLSGPLAITLVNTPPGRYPIGLGRALVFQAPVSTPVVVGPAAPRTRLPSRVSSLVRATNSRGTVRTTVMTGRARTTSHNVQVWTLTLHVTTRATTITGQGVGSRVVPRSRVTSTAGD